MATEEQTKELYSCGQVVLATMIGSMLACSILLARNYEVLNDEANAKNALTVGIGAAIAVLAIYSLVPYSLYEWFALQAVWMFAAREWFKLSQGAAFKEHLAAGGKKASAWTALGIGFLCWAGAMVFSFFVGPVLPVIGVLGTMPIAVP